MDEPKAVSPEKAYDIWKSVALFLAGVVISLLAFWASNFREMVTRSDVENMLEAHTKMSAAQNEIMQLKLDTLTAQIQAMREQVNQLNRNVEKSR